jgi:serine/threonine-protein kinase
MANTVLATPPQRSEAGREHLQNRVRLLAKVMFVLGVLVQTQAFLMLFFGGDQSPMVLWKAVGHLVVMVAITAIWLRTRSGARETTELEIHDVICVFTPIGYWCFALWDAPESARPVQPLLLVVANLLTLRSVLVPSTGRRTAILAVVIVAGLSAWTYAYSTLNAPSATEPAWMRAAVTALSASLSGLIATVASHTIFGLRQEVRRAMQLGQYTLLRKIGEGGMGVVWEAKHAFLRRKTAVKLLPAERAGEEAIARFEREVQITSTLTHPNTIAIYDYGRSADGVFYYAMEYLDGIDLQALVDRDGPQPPGLVAHVLCQLCDALSEAHGVGLIHRDIKPANVILCERGGQPLISKVLDFGLVKRIDGESGDVKLSQANMLIGTPLYMAPEALVSPDRMDARSDLYSVGALGYVMLTGQPVFSGARPLEVFAQHMHSKPVPPSERLGKPIPADLEAILLECLEKEPSLRPKSAAELSARLAKTGAKEAFTADGARAAWERCRELMASEPIVSSPPETRMTLALRSPG